MFLLHNSQFSERRFFTFFKDFSNLIYPSLNFNNTDKKQATKIEF